MKSTKTSRFSKPSHILVGSILALALGATPAMGDATWIGGGGADTNWSNMANWSGNPKAGGSLFINAMASPFTSTVDIDASTGGWTNASWIYMNANTSLYLPTGGKIGIGNGNPGLRSTGTGSPKIYVTGGTLAADIKQGLDTTNPIIEISSGTYNAARITYQKYATVNIIGSAPTEVKVSDFFTWQNDSQPTLGFTLDAGGVTRFNHTSHGGDIVINATGLPGAVTINVGGIATYAAGAMPMGLVIPLVRDTNSNLYSPNSWPLGKLVDGGAGWMSRVSNGVDLTVLQPSLASVWQGGTSDWNTATWNVGGTPNQAAGTKLMTVDVAASVVTVAANASSAVVAIGQTNASTVTVNAGTTLTALTGVVVGANGTLNVDGNLTATAAVLTSAGTTTFAATSGGTIGAVEVTAGTTTLAGSANFGSVYVSGTGTLTASAPIAVNSLRVTGGTVNGPGAITATTNFSFPLITSMTVDKVLEGATASLEKALALNTPTTTLTLTGNNTYGGNTTIGHGTLSVSNLQNAGTASNLGNGTAGAGAIVLVGNSAKLKYTGSSTAIDRGITVKADLQNQTQGDYTSVVDVQISGGGNLGLGDSSLGGGASPKVTLNVTGTTGSRLSLGAVTAGNTVWLSPTSANLTMASIIANATIYLEGTSTNNIVTGVISGFGGGSGNSNQYQISGGTASTWTYKGENTYTGHARRNAGTLKIESPGNGASPNVSTAFGRGNYPAGSGADDSINMYIGNATLHLLNDVSTAYATAYDYPVTANSRLASFRNGGTSTILVDRLTGAGTGGTHKLGTLRMVDGTLNVNGNNGYGLSFEEVTLKPYESTLTINSNTMLSLKSLDYENTGNNGSNSKTLVIGGTGSATVLGALTVTHPTLTPAVTKNGTGTWTLNASGHGGTTQVTAGTLVAAHATSLGTIAQPTIVQNTATLDVRAALAAEPISVTGTGVGGFGALITATANTGTVTGTLTLTGNTSIGGAGTGILNINGLVAAGANTLTTLGTGVTTFGAASDLTSLTNLVVTDGTTNVNSALGNAGDAVVTVSDSPVTKLRFGSVSQTLSSLTIGAGATVIFTSGAASGSLTGDDGGGKAAGFGSPASSFGGGATVPEPGTLGLLLVGALGMLNRRRRA